jgi:hypothetical protein
MRGRASRTVTLAIVGVMIALVSACGSQTASGSATSMPPSPGSAGGSTMGAASQLRVELDDGRGTTTVWTLTCDPPGGDHPDPAAACAALEKGERYLKPVPADLACTQIYGGPETARITGTWRGIAVDATLSRTDGCQIARWNGLAGLLPGGGQ